MLRGKSATYIIQIDIGPSKMCKDEISNGVSALYWVRVVHERIEKPGIFRGNEFSRFLVRPELYDQVSG